MKARKPPKIALGPDAGLPILTRAEEVALGRRVQAGDIEARNALARHNLRLVVRVAKTAHFVRGFDFDTALSAAFLGLIRAADLFDPDRGWRFSTYAADAAKKTIRKDCVGKRTPLRLPQYVIDEAMRHPTDATLPPVAPRAQEVRTERLRASRAILGHAAANDVGDMYRLASHEVSPPDAAAAREADDARGTRAAMVEEAVNCLDDREREIIEARFFRGEPESRVEIGKRLGVCRDRVRQIEVRALASLRFLLSPGLCEVA